MSRTQAYGPPVGRDEGDGGGEAATTSLQSVVRANAYRAAVAAIISKRGHKYLGGRSVMTFKNR